MGLNRYSLVSENGFVELTPFTKYIRQSSDRSVVWRNGMRMDSVSYTNYNDPNFGWLIQLANPHLPALEFLIEEGTEVLIPYPLQQGVMQYRMGLENYSRYYTYK